MNILLNFFPVQSGGGQQVASNFLKVIAVNDYGHNWYIYAGENSELHHLAQCFLSDDKILALPYSYKARLTNSRLLKKYCSDKKINIIYNYAPILPVKGIPQVVRSVYSNLYFPEIDFWGSYPKIVRMKKKVIDYFRLKGTIKADGLIFENSSMQERAINQFHYNSDRTVYIEPSVSIFDEEKESDEFKVYGDESIFKILYLSSWHLNKNIHILPYVAGYLKNKGVKVKFLLSLDANDPAIQKPIIDVVKDKGVEDYFSFLGKVKAHHVHQVVKMSNAMILLSKLECFSSNIIEAFYFGKPLLLADEPWSKAVCDDSAIYVDREDYKNIGERIIQLVSDKSFYENYVKKGQQSLIGFNSPESKVAKQVEFLEYIYSKSS